MNRYGLRGYQRTLVRTATPVATVVYLYDVAIRSCRRAIEAIESGRIGAKGQALDQAMTAVVELAGALDFDRGGAFARRLHSLYAFLMRSLVKANVGNDVRAARGCLAVLRVLREAWDRLVHSRPAVSGQVDGSQLALDA